MEEAHKKLDKKTLWTVILSIYIVGSLLFIIYVFYQNFKIQYSQNAYNNGSTATIEQIITQAEDKTCSPFYVYTASKKVQLINTACLTSTAESATNTNQ